MLRKSLHLFPTRLLAANWRFASQSQPTVKPHEELIPTNGDKNESTLSAGCITSDGKVVPPMPLNEIMAKVVKNDKTMDRIWEMNQLYGVYKHHNQNTDPALVAHQPLNTKIEVMSMHGWDLSWMGIKRRLKLWIKYREENRQRFYANRFADLGPDQAIAHFAVTRGGRARFRHSPDKWATSLGHFPDKYDPRYQTIALDLSKLRIRYEGIDNFSECESLEELDLSGNKLDDWSCQKLGRVFRNSNLRSLNLSNNPLITNRGIESLHWIRSLRTLTITGTAAAKYPFLELLVFSFNDLVPECQVIAT